MKSICKAAALALAGCATLAALAAPHVSETITLAKGWNAIYLESTPASESALCGDFFAGAPVKSVASYHSDAYSYTRQIADDGSEIAQKPVSYYVWVPGDDVASTLFALSGGRTYMIYATDAWSKTFYGVPAAPSQTWRATTGDEGFMNLVGVSADPGTTVNAKAYFGEGPFGTISGVAYKISGTKEEAPPFLSLAIGAKAKLSGGKAYALTATQDADWPGVIGVHGSGVSFSANSNYASLKVENCGASNHTFRVKIVASDDAVATGEVLPPISRRMPRVDALNAGVFTNVVAGEAWTLDLAAGETADLVFSIDRANIEPGAQYGAILVIEDLGGTGMRVRLPITVASAAEGAVAYPTGLWVGEIALSYVSGINDPTPVPAGGMMKLNVMMHVDENRKCTLLQRAAFGIDTNGTARLFKDLAGVPADEVPDAKRLSMIMMSVDTPAVAADDGCVFGDATAFTWVMAPTAKDNPFRHAWHPDHDGKKADYSDYLPAGDDLSLYSNPVKPELWSISNRLEFTWHEDGNAASPVNFTYIPAETTGGVVYWDVGGLVSRGPVRSVGTFTLKRVFKARNLEE